MFTASPRLRGRARTARLVLAAAAFVGLFAMHGLADHGTMHHEWSGPAPDAAATTAAHGLHASAVDASAMHHGDDGVRSEAPSTDGSTLVGLCFAVLVGAVLGLAWLRSRNPLTVVRRWPYPVTRDLHATALRERDPPCLFELSIQRC
ncbi:MAG: DUF6153 family protein [Nocardioidaceae bacterium]